jgi:hypothetical protein
VQVCSEDFPVCFHSPEVFWSQKLAQKPILSLQQTNARLTLSLRRRSSSTQFAKTSSKRLTTLGELWGLSAALTLVRFELQMQLLPPETNLQNCISKGEQSGMLCLFQSAQEREEIMTRSGKGFPERDTHRN